MTRPSEALRDLQRALFVLGFDPGPPDGLWGPRTDAALAAVRANRGRPPSDATSPSPAPADLPWMAEAKRLLGRHEQRDRGFLMTWLKSAGRCWTSADTPENGMFRGGPGFHDGETCATAGALCRSAAAPS
jgi:peptidoglycan hydrolase-like protein with peptidoglycan-binding domain